MITRWKHLFCVSSCVAASGWQKQVDMFFFFVFVVSPDVQTGLFLPVFAWLVWCMCGLWVTPMKVIALGGFSVFLTQHITEARGFQTHFSTFHLFLLISFTPPPVADAESPFPSDSATPCSIVTGWDTWIFPRLAVGSVHRRVMDGLPQNVTPTGSDWTTRRPEGRPSCLSRMNAECSRRNHFTICPSVWPLIPLSRYSAPGSVWIVRAALRPPWPWNIVCRVIPTWAEHSGLAFPIVLFCFLASLAGVLIAQYAIVI